MISNKSINILITGATGFTGGFILDYLASFYEKSQLFATGRNRQKCELLRKKGYTVYRGDLSDTQFVKEHFKHITHVVHCGAKSDIWGDYDSFYQSNVIATKNIVAIPNLEKIIYISTPSIYFDFSDRFNIKESDKLPAKYVNHYSKTKHLGEKLLLNHKKEKVQKYIFRPRAIIGPGDTTLMPRIIRAYEQKRLKIVGDGQNMADFTSVKNLAHIVYLALNKEAQTKQIIFNVTDGQPVKLWSFVNVCLEKMGLSPIEKKAPYKLAFFLATLNENYNKVFSKKEPVLTRYGLGILKYSITLNIDAAKKYLGYKPLITSIESIEDYIILKDHTAKNTKL